MPDFHITSSTDGLISCGCVSHAFKEGLKERQLHPFDGPWRLVEVVRLPGGTTLTWNIATLNTIGGWLLTEEFR